MKYLQQNRRNTFSVLLILMALFSATNLYAQGHEISGTVTDGNDGSPLPGVNILIEGSTVGTTTNFDGNFELLIPSDAVNPVLVVSYVGYKTVRQTIGTQTLFNLSLEYDADELDEIVVVGYQVQKKALVTGANANVKGEDIAALNTPTPIEALQGIAPGVSIAQNNGAPGAGTKVTIRGMGTIGDANPLYLVDGVPVGNIDYLNSSDIESIDVLKDAASAAIYGSRAANGVVLIKTKKGKKGAPTQIDYSGYYGVQNIYKNVTPLNAQEYMFIMDEGRSNDGLDPYNWQAMLTNNAWLNEYSSGLGTQLGDDIWAMLQGGWTGTNWIDEMTTKNAPVQSHSVNITGSSENITYSGGVSYFDQTGLIGGDITDAGYKRLTARLNTEIELINQGKRPLLIIGENFTYTRSENRAVATGNLYYNDLHNAIVQNPLMPVYWDKSPDKYGFTPTLDGIASGRQMNPVAKMYYTHNYNWGIGNNVAGNVYAILEPLENLKFRSSLGLNSWFGNSRSWTPTYQLGVLSQQNIDGVQQDMYQGSSLTWTNTLTYEKQLGDHKITGLLGMEAVDDRMNTNLGGYKEGTNFGTPEHAYLDNANKTTLAGINTWGRNWAAQGGGLLSYMARVSYDYKEKYMVDVTVRADGSSNFAEGNRWGTFPSFSAGWNISDEDFMADVPHLEFAKIRGSWGQNGNQKIPNFIYSSNIAYMQPGYYFGEDKTISSSTAAPSIVPNPDVTWETSEQLNFGLDTRWFNGRLGFNFDWYKKTTKDWLVEAPILGTAGARAPYINGGEVINTGVELVLSWNDNIGDFSYGATFSLAKNKNEVTELNNAEKIINGSQDVLAQGTSFISRVEVGHPIGAFYGYETDGILQNQAEVNAYVGPEGMPYFEDQQPGDVRFVDQNGDGIINDDDKVVLGSPLPDYEIGLQLNIGYKGFYANTTLSGRLGQQVMQSYRSFTDNTTENYTTDIFNRWHGEGTSNKLPRLSSTSHRNNNYISDIYMHDADYVRINNLTVGYQFTDQLENSKHLTAAKIYVSVNNLHTFTGYNGMDPQVSYAPENDAWASGIDLGLYPLPRTVMVGVNMTIK